MKAIEEVVKFDFEISKAISNYLNMTNEQKLQTQLVAFKSILNIFIHNKEGRRTIYGSQVS